MRKITREAADAFVNGRNLSRQNMVVEHWPESGVSRMLLHGNLIAVQSKECGLRMTLAGWNTVTTRERLNGLLDVLGKTPGPRFYQKDFEAYFDGRKIESDEWIIIT